MRRARYIALLVVLGVWLLALGPAPSGAQVGGAGLDLVFLVDGSGSIDATDWEIQKTGIANALQDRAAFPPDSSVAVSVVQWSSSTETEIPYTVLDSQATVDAVAAAVLAMVQNGGGTSPHLGLNAGVTLLDVAQDPGHDQVFCMSTDGSPSSQTSLEGSAAAAESAGVERYSVLAIEDPPFFFADDAQTHYSPAVFGGGTVVTTRNAAEFAALVTGACLGAPVELVGLEVNQSVQDWTNSVPLVADKQTIVRAHVQSLDMNPVRAIGRLFGERNGAELPSSPLLPINPGGSVLAGTDAVGQRGEIDASLNFALPPEWRSGDVTLRLELVGGGVVCSDAAPPASTCSADVSFVNVATPSLRMVEVIYEDAAGVEKTVSIAERDEQAARIVTVMPVPGVNYANAELSRRFVEPDNEDDREDFLADVNEALLTARSNDGLNDLYLGVLRDSIPDGGGGLAAGIGANAASWFLSGTEARDAFGYARNRGPHEVGHAVGERHAADGDQITYCSDNSAGSGAVEYPFVTTIGTTDFPALGPIGDDDTEVWGVDPRFVLDGSNDDLAVIDPNLTFALMGYCNSLDNTSQGRWIDSFYLPRFIDDINGIDWTEGPVPDSGGIWGFFRGLWPFDAQTADVEFRPFFVNSPGVVPIEMPTGDYVLELRDGGGAVLASVGFEPHVFEGDATVDGVEAPSFAMFVIPIANPPDFASAVVVDPSGMEIGSIVASPNPPSVTILEPTAGQAFTGSTVMAAWAGDDPDGDELAYTVQYSADDGVTWQTVAVDVTNTEITIERQEIAGSDTARIRVIASDGTRSASADSETFSVGNNAPAVIIRSPADGQFFSGVQSVFLQAEALDAEDGPLGDAAVVWSSDLDGVLGSGEEVVVLASDLSEGVHVITVSATDTQGVSTSASVMIEIARVAPPPVVDDPVVLLDALIAEVEAAGLSNGITNSLVTKLEGARDKVIDGNSNAACGKLTAFINEVEAQRDKKIPGVLADAWIAAVAEIRALLDC